MIISHYIVEFELKLFFIKVICLYLHFKYQQFVFVHFIWDYFIKALYYLFHLFMLLCKLFLNDWILWQCIIDPFLCPIKLLFGWKSLHLTLHCFYCWINYKVFKTSIHVFDFFFVMLFKLTKSLFRFYYWVLCLNCNFFEAFLHLI